MQGEAAAWALRPAGLLVLFFKGARFVPLSLRFDGGRPAPAPGGAPFCVAAACRHGVGVVWKRRTEQKRGDARREGKRTKKPTLAPSSFLQVDGYKTHRIDAPPSTVTTTKAELMTFFETMFRMRRLEIAADMQYKAKLIRGFCHL